MIPVLFTSFIIYLLLRLGLFFNLEVIIPEGTSGLLTSIYTFDANIIDFIKFSLIDVWTNDVNSDSYNIVLWTMKVELIGSFLIYGFLLAFRRNEHTNWIAAILITIILILIRPLYAAFMLGYLLAELNKKFHSEDIKNYFNPALIEYSILCIFIILILFAAFFRGNDHITLLYASLIVYVVSYSVNLGRFFSNKISHFLGLISFPLYLVQIPIICSWSSYLNLKLTFLEFDPISSMILNLISTLFLCIVAASLLIPLENIAIKYSKIIGQFLVSILLNHTKY